LFHTNLTYQMAEKVVILDFGSQYTQLIARRIREFNIYSEILPYNKEFELDGVKAVILSGSPFSVRGSTVLHPHLKMFIGKVPVLAVCYGAQYLVQHYGGSVINSTVREYGKAQLKSGNQDDIFFRDIDFPSQVWMSHSDTIEQLPEIFELLAATESIPVAAYKSKKGAFDQPVYAVQFHPEVVHSLSGGLMLKNFLVEIANMQGDWTPAAFVDQTIEELKSRIGSDHVVMGLSGGVDSSVGALLLHEAIGHQLTCLFVDNGLLRKNEFEEVLSGYEGLGLNVKGIDAKEAFYNALKGISDPEGKRKAIGRTFIEVFESEAKKLENIHWLGQGTIYPDVIESVSVHGPSVTIKSHHNVGGLPDILNLQIVEPLRMLFKDEVRRVGKTLGLKDSILNRHPFPGPGLGIRILGEITSEKVRLLQEADYIFIQALKELGLYDQVWQAGCILLPIHSVGVMGDERTYEQVVALRAVTSTDGMTADWCKLPFEFLGHVSTEIINRVKGINRVVYDISTKPPSTIEWE
jgi:GMP synthase (glutamine-hydrolysing)